MEGLEHAKEVEGTFLHNQVLGDYLLEYADKFNLMELIKLRQNKKTLQN